MTALSISGIVAGMMIDDNDEKPAHQRAARQHQWPTENLAATCGNLNR